VLYTIKMLVDGRREHEIKRFFRSQYGVVIREFDLTPHSAYIQRAQEAQDTQRPAGPGKVGDMCANASRNDSTARRETSPEERIEARCVAEINQMQASGSGPACAARFSLGGFLPLARASR